jgi:hypothetical protein
MRSRGRRCGMWWRSLIAVFLVLHVCALAWSLASIPRQKREEEGGRP